MEMVNTDTKNKTSQSTLEHHTLKEFFNHCAQSDPKPCNNFQRVMQLASFHLDHTALSYLSLSLEIFGNLHSAALGQLVESA